jgi:hypothetical protein
VERRRSEWLKRYSGLQSVGFGIRHTKRKRLEDAALGILFVVTQKGKPGRGGPLPVEVRARVRTRTGFITVAIPTDVIEGGVVEFQAAFASCDAAGTALVYGNACCPLATTPGGSADFLLGCHHVFLASDGNPGLSPGPVAYVSYNGVRIGEIAASGGMNPGSPPTDYSNDAALTYIDDDSARSALASYWAQWSPTNIARKSLTIPADGSHALYADGAFITAKFIGSFLGEPIPVDGSQSILIPEALVYDADTREGTSGSAFIDQDTGVVLGMHIARMPSTSTPAPWVGVAEPLWQLTSATGPFGRELYLGTIYAPASKHRK